MSDSVESLDFLLTRLADKPVPLVRLAHALFAKGQVGRARELCIRALALAPADLEVETLATEILSRGADYYFPMVRDTARHAAYEAAMRRAIRPGCRVLEIGTGTGLLAMMAARAGAMEVVTCESNLVVAGVATEIIARNGLADRVRVVAKQSSDLEIGTDLSEPADVLIWDILGSNLIGAGALLVMEQAVRRLLRPGAPVIPARGRIRIALAEDTRAHTKQMNGVEGFDLSLFNRLAVPSWIIKVGDGRLALRGDPADLFHFDFHSGGPFPKARSTVSLSASGGLVNGIAQWLRFDMDDQVQYENRPSVGAISAFAAVFHPVRPPIKMAPDATLNVCGTHDRHSIRIWADAREVK